VTAPRCAGRPSGLIVDILANLFVLALLGGASIRKTKERSKKQRLTREIRFGLKGKTLLPSRRLTKLREALR
jgi:hypothetical protein